MQLKNINRTFDDRNLKNRRDLDDLLNEKGALRELIEFLKTNTNVDPSGDLLKKYQGVLVDINKDIGSVNFDLGSSESNRQKAIADIVQKTDDIRIEQGKAFIGQMNQELYSQTLNAMADAAQKVLDINPDDYSKGDPIDFRLQAQQQDLYLAFDESISNMQRMARDGERTAEQASNYALERKALLDADLANAVTASNAEKRAALEARDARAKERVERLRQTLANNEARNFEFNQELNSISSTGINNQINNLRNSARNTPMSYSLDTANKMENDLKVAEITNNTQVKLRELTLEQRDNQNRLSEINRLTAIANKSPEQISQLQQLQVEQGSARSSEQIQKLIDLTQQLDAQNLDGLRQEFENIVTDRAKENSTT